MHELKADDTEKISRLEILKMAKRKLKIFSFFSGSGFLDLGFELNGFDIEFVNEFQPAFMEAYKYSRSKMGLRKPAYGYYNIDINEFCCLECLADMFDCSVDDLKIKIEEFKEEGCTLFK